MLANVDSACLQSTPAHLSVQGKEAKARMPGKPTVFIHYEVFEVVANSDCTWPWSDEVSWNSVGRAHEM